MNLNKYFIYLKQDQEPIPLNIAEVSSTLPPELHYFGRVLEVVEKQLEVSGLVFYLTCLPWKGEHKLPSYGQDVVVIVIGDERSRIPTYFYKVRAVFKCYGWYPILGCNDIFKLSYINVLTLIQFSRNFLIYLPGWLNYKFHEFKLWIAYNADLGISRITPIYDIPLGYHKQLDLPRKSLEERHYDVYFNGSLSNSSSSNWFLRYLAETPKSLSRKKMVSTLSEFKKKYPELRIKLLLTQSFGASSAEESRDYSEIMMNTKICLVPRGTTLETHRFFEALRYGCILVTERLPSRWFYDGSPAVQVNDWNDLEKILQKLIIDKRLAQKKHQESLNWWKTKCSETALGSYIAKQLNSLTS